MLFVFIIMVLFFLTLSAYLSSCETAITLSSKARLHMLSKSGDKRALIIEDMKKDLDLVISSILVCNTTLNTISTALATAAFSKLVGEEGLVYASALMSLLIFFGAEVLPKMFAIYNPEKLILGAAYILKWLRIISSPVAKIANSFAKKILNSIGMKNNINNKSIATEELKGAIDMHTGEVDSLQERAMLKSILDLGSVSVSKIMVHRKNVTMINVFDPIEKIINDIISIPFTRIPIWEGNQDNIIGVINIKKLFREIKMSPHGISELNIKTVAQKPWFVPDTTDLLDQLQAFRQKKEHFSMVVDEYGVFLGIVTLEDILEEIVGEINDEHDLMVEGVKVQQDKSYIVDGTVSVRDLNREFDWDINENVAATIAGFLINSIRTIPNIGQVFLINNFKFEILRKQRNQITLLKIYKIGK